MKKVRFNIGFRKVIHRSGSEIPVVPSCNNQLLMSNDGQLECTPMEYHESSDTFETQSDVSLSYTAPANSNPSDINLGGSENRLYTYSNTNSTKFISETDRIYIVDRNEVVDLYLLDSSTHIGRLITIRNANNSSVRLKVVEKDTIERTSSYNLDSGKSVTLLATSELKWIIIAN